MFCLGNNLWFLCGNFFFQDYIHVPSLMPLLSPVELACGLELSSLLMSKQAKQWWALRKKLFKSTTSNRKKALMKRNIHHLSWGRCLLSKQRRAKNYPRNSKLLKYVPFVCKQGMLTKFFCNMQVLCLRWKKVMSYSPGLDYSTLYLPGKSFEKIQLQSELL